MSIYQELLAEHRALQAQRADAPESLDVQRVLRLIERAHQAGEQIGNPRQRDQLREILNVWRAFVFEQTGQYPPTQIKPFRLGRTTAGQAILAALWPWGVLAVLGILILAGMIWQIVQAGTQIAPTQAPTEETISPTPTQTPTPTPLLPAVYLLPPVTELTVGHTARVDVVLRSARPLESVRLELRYDPNSVQVVDSDPAVDGVQIAGSPLLERVSVNQVQVDEGRVIFQASGSIPPAGETVIASLLVRGVAAGGSALRFEALSLYDASGAVADLVLPADGLLAVEAGPTPTATPSPPLTQTPVPTPPPPPPIDPGNAESLQPRAELAVHRGAVLQLDFAPSGALLASAGADGTVRLWSPQTGQQVGVLSGHTGWVQAVAFSPDSRWLASGGNDRLVRLWDAETLQLVAVFAGHEGFVLDLAFDPTGEILASAGGDGTVRLWDRLGGRELAVLRGHEGRVNAVAFDPTGRLLLSAGSDGTVRLWDTATGRLLRVLPVEQGESIQSIALSPDGKLLATGSASGAIVLWDMQALFAAGAEPTGERLGEHPGGVRSLSFSSNGSVLASGGADGSTLLWDVASARRVGELVGQRGDVTGLTFNPDGQSLASADSAGVIIFWRLEDSE